MAELSTDPRTRHAAVGRPTVAGKFLVAGGRKLYLRGVTYGTFQPGADGFGFPPPGVVERDFALMVEHGINSVRLYSVPPVWLLDEAARRGLWVMVGVPWEQHVAFFDEPGQVRTIEQRVREGVRACAGHPAILAYAVGNEIPASIVRWAGVRRVERHLRRLAEIAREEDPGALVTYANYPSTEYLDLPFLDFVCFNIYLEKVDRLEQYLARLQNLAGERPLVLAEVGLDSRRHGEHSQARSLHEQVSAAFSAGCAGTFVFAWTDEWHRGGREVRDWDFGLTTRDRTPKTALPLVRRAFAESPFAARTEWPRVSVVVCVYNGEETLADCLSGLAGLTYPDVEVIVVDDGSTDRSAEIAGEYEFRLIRTVNRGLSCARNTGLAAATGEVVAYIDADARPDAHWLHYLVESLRGGEFVGAGGPNLACPGDGTVADCVANAPGGPIHVLLSDGEAEHIPGCNMAFRKEALEAIGGFDPRFRVAGDDVDICWRLQERGWRLAFSPSAVVWHHQRDTVGKYWRQQKGYGRAEALLEVKWPEKYNASGQVAWSGRIYAPPLLYALTRTSRVYHGTWGMAPFQPRHASSGVWTSLAAAPEWYLVLLALAAISALGLAWSPLLLALPLLLAAGGASLSVAVRGAIFSRFTSPTAGPIGAAGRRVLTGLLFLLQPAARLIGRFSKGLTPWRFRREAPLALPRLRELRLWSERWREPAQWLESLERRLKAQGAVVERGGPYDRWDLETRHGSWGVVRLRMCVEDHGAGRQLARFRVWPARLLDLGTLLTAGPAVLAVGAGLDGSWPVAAALSLIAAMFGAQVGRQTAAAMALTVEQLGAARSGELVVLPNRVEEPSRSSEPVPREAGVAG